MPRKKEELTLRIQRLKQAIRKKYKQFKYGVLESEERLEQQFKPLISELRKVPPKTDVKVEPKEEEEETEEESEEEDKFLPGTPIRPTIYEDEIMGDPAAVSTPQSTSVFIQGNFSNKLTNEYMKKMYGPESRSLDHVYGPRYEGETLMVGTQVLDFEEDGTIVVGDVRYKPSKGLYELLFKSLPNEEVYNDRDMEDYKDILQRTNAHKKGYRYTGNVNRNTSHKYKQVIERLFPKSGRGWKNAKEKDIARWDDPNELVDRLRHLIVSTETGNQGHVNEIINIVEELKEAKYISGKGNSRFRSLLR